ncbi:hypothetical protein BFL38_05605 [Brachyspira hampsonii]|uniref:Uncharacterized protein n=1 Tax=Brachyspira hampsonii TaxID=1287055 RepID=A0A1E5NDL1_9SPIR|nr:hypothetical protein [Brachyspira hampsonii]OEJ14246.1 hypothetical protein BFL38_05605 [Brachyspira hampsonii]
MKKLLIILSGVIVISNVALAYHTYTIVYNSSVRKIRENIIKAIMSKTKKYFRLLCKNRIIRYDIY